MEKDTIHYFTEKLDSDTAVNRNNEVHNVLGNNDRPILAVNAIQCKNRRINVMWDSDANISLITRRSTQRLGLKGRSTTLSIVKAGDDLTSLDSREVDVPLKDLKGKIWTVQAYEIDEITANLNQVDTQQIQSHFPEIDASIITKPEGKIDMLIGVDSCAIMPIVVKTVGNCQLLENQFGLCVRGSFKSKCETGRTTCATATINASSIKPHFEEINVKTPTDINSKMEQFFTIENLGVGYVPKCGGCRCGKCVTGAKNCTLQEEREMEMIKNGLRYDSERKLFTIEYPWIKDPNCLPNNITAAKGKLRSTEKRLAKLAPDHQKAYSDQMRDMEHRGVARKLSIQEIQNYCGPVHYLHHHEVRNSKSLSTPLRIVFNSSASFMGHILNKYWAKGPDCINSLYAILIRFREYPVAITADISKMYNSIYLSDRDQHVHRYLWRDLETDREPDHYALTAVPFGDRPSGAIALTALHTIANSFKDRNPEAANMIVANSYVDDLITSVCSVREAIKIATEVQDILAEGNFTIKHWTISGQFRPDTPAIKLSNSILERILGMAWEPGRIIFCLI